MFGLRAEAGSRHSRLHNMQDIPRATAGEDRRNLLLSMPMELSAKRGEFVQLPPGPSELMNELA